MDPEEVSIALGIEPDRTQVAGKGRTAPNDQPLPGINSTTFWKAKVMEGGLTELLDRLTVFMEDLGRQRAFLKHLTSTGGECELLLGIFVKQYAGLSFDSEDIAQFADLNLSLAICVYLGDDK